MFSKIASRSLVYFKFSPLAYSPSTFAPMCSRSNITIRLYHEKISDKEMMQDNSHDLEAIPEPPSLLDEVEFSSHTKALQDTLGFFGLDTYYPSGLLRTGLQYLHVTTGLPWWEVIIIGVLVGRAAILPFTIKNMRQMGGMRKHQPQIVRMTNKMNDARKSGDFMEMQMAQFELMKLQKDGNVSMFVTLRNMLPQSLYFMSYFIAIKRMASAPLESMKEGGLLWFYDLTTSDPTWLLSAMCAGTLALTMRTGIDIPTEGMTGALKQVMQIGMPICVLFSTHYFPSAVLIYWTTSNFVSLLLAILFRNRSIRNYLKLSPLPSKTTKAKSVISYDEDGNPVKRLSHFATVKVKINELLFERGKSRPAPMDEDMRRADHAAFRKAGQGPITPTYPYNPREKYAEVFKEDNTFLTRLLKGCSKFIANFRG